MFGKIRKIAVTTIVGGGLLFSADNLLAGDRYIPEGYQIREITVGDASLQYLVPQGISAEELAEIAPAAGPGVGKVGFTGPRQAPQNAEVWSTADFE